MKITRILTADAGPLGTTELVFRDEWSEEASAKILLSGPNGSGKSNLLEAVAALWSNFGFWLERRQPYPEGRRKRERWLGFAVRLEVHDGGPRSLWLAVGEENWVAQLERRFPQDLVVGEARIDANGGDGHLRLLKWPESREAMAWLDDWTRDRQRMVTSEAASSFGNVVFLDAERRRWVQAKEGIGEFRQESLNQRWLAQYLADEKWESQLEAGLLNLKIAVPERFDRLIDDMNGFLLGKRISKEVKLGENRLWVELAGGQERHLLDELSSGERQVLILLYQVGRWLAPGGIALIDEPDLHIHPSLVPDLLGQLEKMVVSDRRGQLFITSHAPEVWQRYEAIGQRVLLEAAVR